VKTDEGEGEEEDDEPDKTDPINISGNSPVVISFKSNQASMSSSWKDERN